MHSDATHHNQDTDVDRARSLSRELATMMDWTLADVIHSGRARWPARVAVADDGVSLTFEELHGCATRVAVSLRDHGVRPGDRVAIAGEREVDTVVAILGACLLGATFVPLDPGAPHERLRFLLEDADVRGLIGVEALKDALPDPSRRFFLSINGLSRKDAPEPSPLPELPRVNAECVAYIMYTSGSTGRPKGVQIEHHGVRVFFETHNERAHIRPGDRCLNSGPFHFDVSLMDVFLPLFVGASVYFGSKLPLRSLVLGALERHRITHFYAVGSVLSLITGDGRKLDDFDLSSLRVLQTGAEVCNVRVVNEWLRRYPKLAFLNSYGPTEATVGCISYLKPTPGPLFENECPIGRPHRHTSIILLDEAGQRISRRGQVGELLIGGPQLMRAYWRRDLENERAFVWLDGVRFYRSGDYAYLDERGNYRFVGRRDDELKLNGHRIHLNEVLHCVQDEPSIEAAIAGVVRGPTGIQEMAVIAVSSGRAGAELLSALESRTAAALPDAVRPRRWAFLPAFPRLPSGKVDREQCLAQLTRALNTSDSRYYTQIDETFCPLDLQ